MTELEAKRNLALQQLGWLGEYGYDDLPVTDQLYIDQLVARMDIEKKRSDLLEESMKVLKTDCPCCGYPNCGHEHGEK